jgi:hypothetical protein
MPAVRALSILGVLLLAACDQAGTSTALPRPTTSPVKVTSFNGTLLPLATNTHVFSVAQEGYVEVTLLGLAAPSGTEVALAIGTPSLTGTCATTQTVTTPAGPTAQIVGTGLPGNLCITVSDIGNLTDSAVYTVTVASS